MNVLEVFHYKQVHHLEEYFIYTACRIDYNKIMLRAFLKFKFPSHSLYFLKNYFNYFTRHFRINF
jgi:hypothetical protein